MSAIVAVALNNTQATGYATAAALIAAFGFAFVTGERVKKGRDTWALWFRIVVRGLFFLMLAGEIAAFAALLADRYWLLAHAFVIAGIGAAIIGVFIEGSIQVRIFGEPGSRKARS